MMIDFSLSCLFSYEKIFLDDRKYDARFAMDISQGVL